METLRAIRVDDGRIVATAPDGTQFLVEVDDAIRAALRQAALRTSSLHEPTLQTGALRKVPVRDIQGYIREGLTSEEVAELTGFPVYDIRRYEGPVLAEREHVITSALAVPVQLPGGGLEAPVARFGAVIARRLEQLAARGPRWASWKDPKDGWMLKLNFTSDGVDHDARWSFDLKKAVLSPINSEATALSQQHEATGTLMPRLRALPSDEAPAARPEPRVEPIAPPSEPPAMDSSRFDSAIFDLTPREPGSRSAAARETTELPRTTQRDAPAAGTPIVGTSIISSGSESETPRSPRDVDTTEVLPGSRGAGERTAGERVDRNGDRSGPARRVEPRTGSVTPVGRDTLPPDLGETADLLDALRRRRSEREAARSTSLGAGSAFRRPEADPSDGRSDRSTGATVKMFERPTSGGTGQLPPPPRQLPNSGKGPRRGRANLPSWDEIVFGARPDDEDPA
ncbi:septation protein SepH [Naasia lichenicola]|uniref:septation protein SepH n=1 Tax=Naasia lichenicola TaxID=2565933 RepID=UPI00130E8E1C|nr:septation protein SepH [Naasia lichenicola]